MGGSFRHCAALGVGLTQNPALRLESGHWAFEPQSATMFLSPARPDRVDDADRGAVAHEAAHRISHYLSFPALEGVPTTLWRMLSNAAEDTRIHEWIYRVYSREMGVWVSALRQAHPLPREAPASAAASFIMACSIGERVDYSAPTRPVLSDETLAALEATAAARRAYACDFLPEAIDAELSGAGVEAAFDREVRPLLNAPLGEVSFSKAVSFLASARAHRVLNTEIAPALRALIDRDLARLKGAADDDAALDARLRCASGGDEDRARAVGEALMRARPSHRMKRDPGLLDALEAYIRSSGPLPDTPPSDRAASKRGGLISRRLRRRAMSGDDTVEEAAALADRAIRQVDALAASLSRLLRSERPGRWSRGFRSGRRVDVRALLRREADPQADGVWMRRVEEQPVAEAHVVMLVDLSGSMAGAEIAHAAAAVTAIATAMRRLDRLVWRVFGFQDVLIPLADSAAPLKPAELRRQMIEEVGNSREGGNNRAGFNDDGPCLLEAAAHLPQGRGGRRVLMVLSDGAPAGRRSGSSDLKRAVAEVTARGVNLVGLGIGPGTAHVSEFYPQARAEVPLDDLAREIAGLLESALRRRSLRIGVEQGAD